ncbi:MAG: hypothetical protein JNK86_04375 [Alphaproteobacteria bacterium]|nr:hypothetical protein [Alphaproteobacteria bacterium]
MAGGRNVPDIGVQYPSNPNMMQIGQSGGKGNDLPNLPASSQNNPLTPNTQTLTHSA